MKEYSFEKLEVWKLSKEFAERVYKLTKVFPDSEKYGITNQLRRAAISVPNNIAEGSGRITGKDKANFTQISYGSLMECLNLLIISKDFDYINASDLQQVRLIIDNLSVMLSKFRKAQLEAHQR